MFNQSVKSIFIRPKFKIKMLPNFTLFPHKSQILNRIIDSYEQYCHNLANVSLFA